MRAVLLDGGGILTQSEHATEDTQRDLADSSLDLDVDKILFCFQAAACKSEVDIVRNVLGGLGAEAWRRTALSLLRRETQEARTCPFETMRQSTQSEGCSWTHRDGGRRRPKPLRRLQGETFRWSQVSCYAGNDACSCHGVHDTAHGVRRHLPGNERGHPQICPSQV